MCGWARVACGWVVYPCVRSRAASGWGRIACGYVPIVSTTEHTLTKPVILSHHTHTKPVILSRHTLTIFFHQNITLSHPSDSHVHHTLTVFFTTTSSDTLTSYSHEPVILSRYCFYHYIKLSHPSDSHVHHTLRTPLKSPI